MRAVAWRVLGVAWLAVAVAGIGRADHAFDVVVLNGRVMDPETGFDAVRNVGITDGRIVRITEDEISGAERIDAAGHVVAPGFIDTDMTKDLPEDNRAAMLAQVPLGKLGDTADIANAVVFLASPGGAYITGETLHVNGGMVMD